MNEYQIDKVYGVPLGYISCPSCGQRYGHHNTKVDVFSEECSSCVKNSSRTDAVEFVTADVFIQRCLGYTPHNY